MKHRKSLRLADYDYSQAGLYFVTICVADRQCRLSVVSEDGVELTKEGSIVNEAWQNLLSKYPAATLDVWVVMPNHFHGVLGISDIDDAPRSTASPPRHPALGDIVKTFKAKSTVAINAVNKTPGAQLWQSRYYDHVIRSESDLDRIRLYIAENPGKWADDPENPASKNSRR